MNGKMNDREPAVVTAAGHDGRQARLNAALFGIKNGAVWVAEDAFVTRAADNILVEKWVGQRLVSILIRPASAGSPSSVWSRLNEVAMDTT